MESNEIINVDGYFLTLEWYKYISSDSFAENVKKCSGKISIMDISQNTERKNKKWELFVSLLNDKANIIETSRLKSEIFWKLTQVYVIRPKEPFEKTMELLNKYA